MRDNLYRRKKMREREGVKRTREEQSMRRHCEKEKEGEITWTGELECEIPERGKKRRRDN
jgi:hypothetical protein